jgi:NitT/TauT family transport system substrate-binding protein
VKKVLKSSLFSIVILFVAGVASAETIKVGYSAIAGNQLPAWVAMDAGIFKKNGLDVELVNADGNVAVIGLLSGNFGISQVAGPAVVNSALKGSDIVYVAGGMTSLNYYLMVRPEIKRPEQLKGKIVAISRFGSASDFITQLALERIGLKAGKDVVIVQMGDAPRRIEAAMANQIQGVVLDPPANVIAERGGLMSLVNLAEQGLVYQHTGAATTKRYVREHPDLVSALRQVAGRSCSPYLYRQGNIGESAGEILWQKHRSRRTGGNLEEPGGRANLAEKTVSFV